MENLPENQKDVIIFEANKARELYTTEVTRKKAAGEKVNPLTIKRESVALAKEATLEKFGEELFNEVSKVIEDNKGGVQSVTGKTKAPKAPKATRSLAKPKPLFRRISPRTSTSTTWSWSFSPIRQTTSMQTQRSTSLTSDLDAKDPFDEEI